MSQTKLESISDAISQAIQDKNILPAEFHKMLKDMEKYRKLKEGIRRQNKAKVREITKKSDKNCLNKEEKKPRKIFYEKVAGTFFFIYFILFNLHLTSKD